MARLMGSVILRKKDMAHSYGVCYCVPMIFIRIHNVMGAESCLKP
jgi:hypothetical protein